MRKLYWLFRVLAYACGIVGLALFVNGRQSGDPQSPQLMIGGALIILSTLFFLFTYFMLVLTRLRRPG